MTNYNLIGLIGNIFTMIGGIISLAIIYQKLVDKVEVTSKRVDKQEETIDELTRMGLMTTVAQHERRITTLEVAISDLGELKNDIKWIKHSMKHEDS